MSISLVKADISSPVSGLGASLADGASSVAVVLQNAVILLLANPRVQKRAQEELDRVVGQDRLPAMEDMDRLPYFNALAEEVRCYVLNLGGLRWDS